MATATLSWVDLLAALEPCAKVVAGQGRVGPLQCLRLDFERGFGVRVVGGDGAVWSGRAAECEAEDASALIPADRLVGLLSAMTGELARLDVDGQDLVIECGRDRAVIAGKVPDDYPMPNQEPSDLCVSPSYADWKEAVRRTRDAISDDRHRPILCGLFLRAQDGKMVTAATNTHIAIRTHLEASGGDVCAVLPETAVKAISTLGFADAEEVPLFFSDRAFRCERGGAWVAGMLPAGDFPKFDRVFPPTHSRVWRFRKGDVEKAVRLAQVAGDKTSTGGVCAILREADGVVVVEPRDSFSSQVRAEVAAVKAENTDGFRVAMDSRFLMDALGACPGGEIELRFTESTRPLHVVSPACDEWDAVIMPMSLVNR